MNKSNELDNILKELDELGVLMDNEYGEEDEDYLLDEEDEDKEDENEEDEDEEDEDEDKDGTY